MRNIDLKNYLFHGIVDWLYYNENTSRDSFCLEKLDSILKCRFIYRPCEFKKYGITHNDQANHYTYYFTFVACHPDSIYSVKYKKEISYDNGYTVATNYSKFGILFDPKLLDELTIIDDAFTDKEIMFDDDISLDAYAVGIYINPTVISKYLYEEIVNLVKKYIYNFVIVSILDGSIIETINPNQSIAKNIRF